MKSLLVGILLITASTGAVGSTSFKGCHPDLNTTVLDEVDGSMGRSTVVMCVVEGHQDLAVEIFCPDGKSAERGGHTFLTDLGIKEVKASTPHYDQENGWGWRFSASTTHASKISVSVIVVCD